MACASCANRAKRLFEWLGLVFRRAGPNNRAVWIFETNDVAVLIPGMTAKHMTTRATILVGLARLLFGSSRASEPPTVTEVWRLKRLAQSDIRRFGQKGTTVQTFNTPSFVEVRRGLWLRLIGPIEERVVLDESVDQPIVSTTPLGNELTSDDHGSVPAVADPR